MGERNERKEFLEKIAALEEARPDMYKNSKIGLSPVDSGLNR